jgi:HAD superfamily hydrolase (TIGR01490 family)
MDGTLTRANTFLAYLKFVLTRRAHRIGHCIGLPFAVAQFRCGMRSRDSLKQEFVHAVLAGCSREEIDGWTRAFTGRYGSRLLKPRAADAIRRHRSFGHRLIVATASIDAYAAALAEKWGVAETVSTRLKWEAGRLTGLLDGPNLRGEAKLAAVREVLGCGHSERPRVFAYSDDHSDLPLLRFADSGFAVDPTRRLADQAPHDGLQILRWNAVSTNTADSGISVTEPRRLRAREGT